MADVSRFFARYLTALVAIAGTTMPSAAQEWAGDPNSVIYALYQNYRPDGEAMAAEGFAKFLTPNTRELFERALRNTDEATTLDADPFCNCQDWGTIEVQSVLLTMETEDRAKAIARIVDTIEPHKPRVIVFELHRTSEGWRVHDAGPGDSWSLRSVIDSTPKGKSDGR